MKAAREWIVRWVTGAIEADDKAPTSFLTGAYVVALSVIAVLSVGAHLVLGTVIDEHESTGTIVNLSGKQRVTSQRVALFAERFRDSGLTVDRQMLRAAVEDMAQRHEHLISNTDDDDAPHLPDLPDTMPEKVRAIYFDAPENLDQRVRQFLDYGRQLANADGAASSSAEEAYAFIQTQGTMELLESLDAVVQAYEDESVERIGWLAGLQSTVLTVIIITLAAEALLIFRPLVRRVQAYAARLFHLAMTDTMTGASNRRAFMDQAAREISRARRHDHPLSVLLLDIDRFKAINDSRGHAVGDEAIRHLVTTMRDSLRPEDLVGRLGGEEFAILTPYASADQAFATAERLRRIVQDDALTASDGKAVCFTVSIGVCSVDTEQETIEPALINADVALYRSKTQGRNQSTLFEPGMAMA